MFRKYQQAITNVDYRQIKEKFVNTILFICTILCNHVKKTYNSAYSAYLCLNECVAVYKTHDKSITETPLIDYHKVAKNAVSKYQNINLYEVLFFATVFLVMSYTIIISSIYPICYIGCQYFAIWTGYICVKNLFARKILQNEKTD